MKEKIEEAIKKCLEENGYKVRQVEVTHDVTLNMQILDVATTLNIRAIK